MSTDFQHSLAERLTGKFATNSYLNIPSHLKHVATLIEAIVRLSHSKTVLKYLFGKIFII